MLKPLLATAVAVSTSIASFAAFAADAPAGGAFVHFGTGKANYHTKIKAFDGKRAGSYDLMAGYRWDLGRSFALGVEGGFAYLGAVERKTPTEKNRMVTAAWLVGANAKWNMTEHLSLIGRLGTAHVSTRFSYQATGAKKATSLGRATRSTPYFGLGFGYALTDHLDLTLQATRYGNRSVKVKNEKGKGNDWSATTYNAGVEYRF